MMIIMNTSLLKNKTKKTFYCKLQAQVLKLQIRGVKHKARGAEMPTKDLHLLNCFITEKAKKKLNNKVTRSTIEHYDFLFIYF